MTIEWSQVSRACRPHFQLPPCRRFSSSTYTRLLPSLDVLPRNRSRLDALYGDHLNHSPFPTHAAYPIKAKQHLPLPRRSHATTAVAKTIEDDQNEETVCETEKGDADKPIGAGRPNHAVSEALPDDVRNIPGAGLTTGSYVPINTVPVESLEGALHVPLFHLVGQNGIIPYIGRSRASSRPLRFKHEPAVVDFVRSVALELGLNYTIGSLERLRKLTEAKKYVYLLPDYKFLNTSSSDTSTNGSSHKLDAMVHITNSLTESMIAEAQDLCHDDPALFGSIHSKILLSVCGSSPDAIPQLTVSEPAESRGQKSSLEDPLVRVVLLNMAHNINITRKCARSQVHATVLEAILWYCIEIQKYLLEVPAASSAAMRFTGSMNCSMFLQRAASLLEWGEISYRDSSVSMAHCDDLWESDVTFARVEHKIRGSLWPSRRGARFLATMQACAYVKPFLTEAYRNQLLDVSEYYSCAKYWIADPSDLKSLSQVSEGDEPYSTLPTHINIDSYTLKSMARLLQQLRSLGFEDNNQDLLGEISLPPRIRFKTRSARQASLDYSLKNSIVGPLSKKQQRTERERMSLPLMQDPLSRNIVTQIQDNDLTIITAATGSGKTTQIPQLIFDDYIQNERGSQCHVICTQPRRVSTISVASRVAQERRQKLGTHVGYSVRFDDKPPAENCGITFATSGYLQRLLEGNYLAVLSTYSHIVLDEVHIRDVDSDLLLTTIKTLFQTWHLRTNSDLQMPKIVLMSATIDADFFYEYFKDVLPGFKCAQIDVPGRAYPVETRFLDEYIAQLGDRTFNAASGIVLSSSDRSYLASQGVDAATEVEVEKDKFESVDQDFVAADETESLSDSIDSLPSGPIPIGLIAATVATLLQTTTRGDILVFLPGLAEIDSVESLLKTSSIVNADKHPIFKLHSMLYETNFDVFEPIAETNRRLILSTNIAETSLTLPDVVYVVDSGRSRMASYDQVSQTGGISMRWISQAEVIQRRGRAGRTQPGQYIAMFSESIYKKLRETPEPELLRINLAQLVLRCRASRVLEDIKDNDLWSSVLPGSVLLEAPSPPPHDSLIAAADQVKQLRGLTPEGKITQSGRVLSTIPTPVQTGRALLLAALFQCTTPILFAASSREDASLMSHPESTSTVTQVRKNFAKDTAADFLADANAFFQYEAAIRVNDKKTMQQLVKEAFIRKDTYLDIAQTATQIYGRIEPLIQVGHKEPCSDESVDKQPARRTRYHFPDVSEPLDLYGTNTALVKAILFATTGHKLALWDRKNWSAPEHPRILPSPRSVNHATPRKAIVSQRLQREPGDVLAYGSLRIKPGDKYPWAGETWIVSALTAILFGQQIKLINSTILVNDWIRYEIVSDDGNHERAAKIVHEYRKAVDRFILHALHKISLDPAMEETASTRQSQPFNFYFSELEHPVRRAVVDSVAELLLHDDRLRKERAQDRIKAAASIA